MRDTRDVTVDVFSWSLFGMDYVVSLFGRAVLTYIGKR
jgi:hypothetical protein